ncbi:TPA: hypothetical protein HA295_03135 [Candidatus Woesearchaeota archaeon]|nr:hypothetical protein [Candidatus Woesearchaeota archaeon]HII65743.1 hypothetical protein [Candidatus Woesearchaeota archaeon]
MSKRTYMNPLKIILAGILLAVILAGCGKQSTQTGSTAPFIGGTTGLVIDFEEDSPPAEVTDDGSYSFNTIVRLENRGEYKLQPQQVRVSLEGFLPSDFSSSEGDLIDRQPSEILEPRRRDANGNVIDGTVTFVTIPSEGSSPLVPKKFTGNVQFPFRANVCYKYGTTANARICVLKDLLNKQSKAICDPNTGKSVASSSSPIQISGFRESVIGRDKISFSFDVIHSGNGNVFKSDTGDAVCPRDAREMRQSEDQVSVRVDAEGLNNLNCNFPTSGNAGFVRLISGKRTITCTLDLSGQHNTDYEKIIDISAEFNYRDYKDKTVLVKHLIE